MHAITPTEANQGPPPLKVKRQRGKRFEPGTPEARRDAAMGRLNDRRARLIRVSQRRVIHSALLGKSVTADDLRDLEVGELHRHFAGAVFRLLNSAGVLIADGYQASAVPGSHARPVLRWILRDRAVAEQWLKDHPDPDPLAPPTQQRLELEVV